MKHWCVIAVVVGTCLPAAAQPPAFIAQQPQFMVVGTVNEAAGMLTLTTAHTIYQKVVKEVEADAVNDAGQIVKVKRKVEEVIPVYAPVTMSWSAAGGKAFDGTGKPLSKEDLFKRVKAGSVVLTQPMTKIDPRILPLLRADVVILQINRPLGGPVAVPIGPLPQPVPLPPQPVPLPKQIPNK